MAPPDPPSLDRLLLDTHVFLWWQEESERLTPHVAHVIATAERVHVSVASAWEIAIKVGSGKLRVRESLAGALEESQFRLLPVTLDHVGLVAGMPHHHRDPFDRMLAAQAVHEGLTLVTHDRAFSPYALPVLWM